MSGLWSSIFIISHVYLLFTFFWLWFPESNLLVWISLETWLLRSMSAIVISFLGVLLLIWAFAISIGILVLIFIAPFIFEFFGFFISASPFLMLNYACPNYFSSVFPLAHIFELVSAISIEYNSSSRPLLLSAKRSSSSSSCILISFWFPLWPSGFSPFDPTFAHSSILNFFCSGSDGILSFLVDLPSYLRPTLSISMFCRVSIFGWASISLSDSG